MGSGDSVAGETPCLQVRSLREFGFATGERYENFGPPSGWAFTGPNWKSNPRGGEAARALYMEARDQYLTVIKTGMWKWDPEELGGCKCIRSEADKDWNGGADNNRGSCGARVSVKHGDVLTGLRTCLIKPDQVAECKKHKIGVIPSDTGAKNLYVYCNYRTDKPVHMTGREFGSTKITDVATVGVSAIAAAVASEAGPTKPHADETVCRDFAKEARKTLNIDEEQETKDLDEL